MPNSETQVDMKQHSLKDLINSLPDMASLFFKADIATGIALVILSMIGVSAYKTRDKLTEYSARATHTNEILLELRETIANVQNAESGISNYLLTQDEVFLDPYKKAVENANQRQEKLVALVADHPEQQQKVYKLNTLIHEKLEQLYRTIKSYDPAVPGRGIQPRVILGGIIMSDIHKLTNEIETEQSNFLKAQVKEADLVAQKSYVTLALASALVFIFLFGSRIMVSRQTARRLLAEVELKKTSLALENAVEGISRVDVDGNYISINKTFAAILGFSAEDLIGKNWLSIILPDDHKRILGAHQSMLLRGKAESEAIGVCRDKSTCFLKMTMIQNQSDGIFSGHYCFISDISIQKKENIELINARRAAQEASVAKSEFLANMSHEIRTPMNGVIGMTGLMATTPLNDQQKQYLDTIKVSAQALLSLINDILDLSKIESRKMTFESIDFDIEEVVNDAKKILTHTASNKGIGLNVDIAPMVPRALKGDPGKLRQILVNLMGNAVKFTSQGEVSTFITMLHEDTDTIELRVEVHDTGIGISPDDQSRLFQAFNQADNSTSRKYGGTGLGLAICKRLVDMMHGNIGVQSEAGKGSTFWFNVRLERGNPENIVKATEKDYQTVAFNRPDLHILIVEDNLVNQKVAIEMVSQLGFTVNAVADGATAIKTFQEKTYHLIFMDCHLPDMDGYETTREIRKLETNTHIPIIALTADVTSGDRKMAFEAGMDDYATKPIEFSVLAEIIQKWLKLPSTPKTQSIKTIVEDEVRSVSLPLVNWDALDRLGKFQKAGSPSLIEEMISLYFSTTPQALAQIQAAAVKRDHETLRETAHGIKSASAQIGLTIVSELCRQIEYLEDEQITNGEAVALAKVLLEEYEKSTAELNEGLKTRYAKVA